MQHAAVVFAEVGGDAVGQAQALEARDGDDDGAVLAVRVVELGQAGADVAADVGEGEVREVALELGDAAEGAGADDGAGREVGESADGGGEGGFDDEGVAGVVARGHCAERAVGGELRGHILERVDDEVELAGLELEFQLGGPERFLVEFVQGGFEVVVGRRGHGVDLEVVCGPVLFQLADDLVGLHAGEEGAAGADVEGLGGGRGIVGGVHGGGGHDGGVCGGRFGARWR